MFDDELLKICDFGMAKDIRYVDYYRREVPVIYFIIYRCIRVLHRWRFSALFLQSGCLQRQCSTNFTQSSAMCKSIVSLKSNS